LRTDALAHLKVVIATKLRRSESFTLTWVHPDDQPAGRSVIWISPSIPLRFVQDDPEPIELNRAWIEDLARSASSSSGIILSPEHFNVPITAQPEPLGGESLEKVSVAELSVGHLAVAGPETTERPPG